MCMVCYDSKCAIQSEVGLGQLCDSKKRHCGVSTHSADGIVALTLCHRYKHGSTDEIVMQAIPAKKLLVCA